MKLKGIDTAAKISAAAAKQLKADGISFAGRYLVPESMWKALTAAEADGLRGAGLAILLCWEMDTNTMRQGAARGAQDGNRARQLAEGLGVPAGTVIYFACDYNAPTGDYELIADYVLAAQAALGRYEAGVYGHARLVDWLAQKGVCRKFWQCCAWSSGRLSAHATAYQYQWSGGAEAKAMAQKVGFSVDMNTCDDLRAAGLWLPSYNTYDEDDGSVTYEPAKETPEPWYAKQMAWAKQQGLINDGRPNDPVTRAELATVLYRIYGPEDEKKDSGMLSE